MKEQIERLISELPEERRKHFLDRLKSKEEKINKQLELEERTEKQHLELVETIKQYNIDLMEVVQEGWKALGDRIEKAKVDIPKKLDVEVKNFPKDKPFPKDFKIVNLQDIIFPKELDINNISEQQWITDQTKRILGEISEIKSKLDSTLEVRVKNSKLFAPNIKVSGGGQAIIPFRDDIGNSVKPKVDELGNLNTSLEKLGTSFANAGVPMRAGDSSSVDAFGRWRVSSPQTLFDSKNIFNDPDQTDASEENQPLFYDNQETSGGGTGTTYDANESSQTLTVSDSTAGVRVRQTKMRFNYQPGKSQEILMTFNLNGTAANIVKREGIFDDNNGLFLEADGTTINFVRRTYVSGSAVDNGVTQSDWNLDPMDGTGISGIALDFTKTQIMIIDYEWLGVGRVRMGFVINGMIYYAHEFLNSNGLDVVYMSTPNLPLRSEIQNDGSGAADSITQICSTVISEGGSQDLGVLRYASTAGTHIDMATENTIYAVIGIRLKSAYIGATIKLINMALQLQTASHECEWILKFNPTVAGTFTYADQANSAVQIARGTATSTVTGGYDLRGGFIESAGVASGSNGSFSGTLDNALLLGSLIDGTVDQIVLCARPIAGSTDVDIEGSLTWREI